MTEKSKTRTVHLSDQAREDLARIQEVWNAKDGVPPLTSGAAVATALRIWADILDPETDASVYSDAKLMELLRARCFMNTCEGLAKVIEASELFEGTSWALSGDPETETITVTVEGKQIKLAPPVGQSDKVPSFQHTKPRSLGEPP